METATAEVDSPQTESEFSIENASTDDLRNALGITPATEEVQPSTEAPQPEDTVPEPEAESQSPEPQAEEAQPEDTEADEEEKLGKRRIRPRNELDQQVIDLYRSEGFQGSFADASRIIYGQEAQQPAQQSITPNQEQVEATEPDPISGIDKQADDIRASILELEGKVEKAAEELETTEALKLQREIMKQELQLQTITLRKEQMLQEREQVVYQTHRSKAMESRDRVYDRFPDLKDKQSVYRKQFDDYVTQAQSDPDYAAVFDSPKWPEIIANEFASLHQAPVAQQEQLAPAPAPAPAPQMGTQAKVLTTGTTAQPVNAQVTADGLLQQLPQMSNDDLYKLLGSPGGASPLR
jgi:hypothetical protein